MNSAGATCLVGSFFGAGVGAFESVARNKPFLASCFNVGLNVGLFSSLVYMVREGIATLRTDLLKMNTLDGFDGAAAGALSGFVACRHFGRHGRYAYVGAAWISLVAGSVDALLTKAWRHAE